MARTLQLVPGDRVSFLDFEHGVREGVGGRPGKRPCIFAPRRRYTGTVVETTEIDGLIHADVRFDPGQAFDEAKEVDGARFHTEQEHKLLLVQQHSFRKL